MLCHKVPREFIHDQFSLLLKQQFINNTAHGDAHNTGGQKSNTDAAQHYMVDIYIAARYIMLITAAF